MYNLQRDACTNKNQNLAHIPALLFDFLAFSFKAFAFGLSGGQPLLFDNCGSCWVIFGTDTLIEVDVCVDWIFVSRESLDLKTRQTCSFSLWNKSQGDYGCQTLQFSKIMLNMTRHVMSNNGSLSN
ncbi:hypothetical protein BpHYR1_004177 [Brachionus plicatilis]|uniref:Uncharacterized protein n=1 Tax=Brachionus plicatilis TaxID=10195 RepID=A0A3M7QFC6_BRAPC|nr:hypothetical protein BpHYR1_004177 [Brachionus plicatilis]